jgi:hypothetical protein
LWDLHQGKSSAVNSACLIDDLSFDDLAKS